MNDNAVLDNYLTVTVVASLLNLSTARIRQMLRDETMQGVKVGPRLWMIPKSEVERAIQRGNKSVGTDKED